MTSNVSIKPGDLVTTNDIRYGYYEKLFHSKCTESTIYHIDDTKAIEKGSIGIVTKLDGIYVKVLWNTNRQAVILLMHNSDIILLDKSI